MFKMLALVLSATVSGVGLGWVMPTEAPANDAAFYIEVVTYDGNAFVAGMGSDCYLAQQNARIPAEWQRIACYAAQ